MEAPKPRKKPRPQPGISATVLAQLEKRDGRRCAWAGMEGEDLVPHHRSNRGMGGDRSKNRLSNIVWLPSHINSAIESDADLQAEAKRRGIKISLHADPRAMPIEHAVHGLCLLDDWGGVELLTPAEAREWRALMRTWRCEWD